jgi:hypothetical protein
VAENPRLVRRANFHPAPHRVFQIIFAIVQMDAERGMATKGHTRSYREPHFADVRIWPFTLYIWRNAIPGIHLQPLCIKQKPPISQIAGAMLGSQGVSGTEKKDTLRSYAGIRWLYIRRNAISG